MKQETLQLTGGAGSNKRRELDFYPTPPEVTISLMDFLKLEKCNILEPACGNGGMAKTISSYGHFVIAFDISQGMDYLKTDIDSDIYAIITNPPFNLSHLFIEKALKEATLVAMLLKSQYWHARKRYNLFNNNKPSYILPLTWRPDFLNGLAGGAPTMEVCWTVWIKGNDNCKYIPLLKPENNKQSSLFK